VTCRHCGATLWTGLEICPQCGWVCVRRHEAPEDASECDWRDADRAIVTSIELELGDSFWEEASHAPVTFEIRAEPRRIRGYV
jgi:hypothetical protein